MYVMYREGATPNLATSPRYERLISPASSLPEEGEKPPDQRPRSAIFTSHVSIGTIGQTMRSITTLHCLDLLSSVHRLTKCWSNHIEFGPVADWNCVLRTMKRPSTPSSQGHAIIQERMRVSSACACFNPVKAVLAPQHLTAWFATVRLRSSIHLQGFEGGDDEDTPMCMTLRPQI